MKKLLLIGAVMALAAGAYAQGYVNFANLGSGISAPVTNGIGGARVPAGGAFLAQLYYGTAGSPTDAAFIAVTNAPITFATPGFFSGSGRFTDPLIVGAGQVGSFQFRVWEAALGATWEAALANAAANPNLKLGKSNIAQVKAENGAGQPLPTPANLVGILGFAVTPVPEPSTIAFGIMGLGALLLLRRRK